MIKTALVLRAAIAVFACSGLMALAFASGKSGPAGSTNEPRIALIEIAGEYAAIHVYTEPGRKYILQAATSLPAGNWTPIWTNRVFPFDYHWVVADKLTNKSRIYRLYLP